MNRWQCIWLIFWNLHKFTNTKMPPFAEFFPHHRILQKPWTRNRRNKTQGWRVAELSWKIPPEVKAETEGRAAGGRDPGHFSQMWIWHRGVGDWVGFRAYWDFILLYMGVSENRGGPPKWMVYNGRPYRNDYLGGTPIFGNTHINIY